MTAHLCELKASHGYLCQTSQSRRKALKNPNDERLEHTEKHKSQITFLHRVYKQICDFIIKQTKNIYRISHFCKSIPPSDHTSHFLCFIALIAEPLFPTSLRGGESTLGINYFCVNVICDLCRWSTRASRRPRFV